MTTEEFLALHDDGVRRRLIDGEVKERGPAVRDRLSAAALAILAAELLNWSRTRPEPRGGVLVGDAGVIISRDPDTVIGVDAAFIHPELLMRQRADADLIEGVPLLVADLLAPGDTMGDLAERRALYRRFRVQLVWIVSASEQAVTVYRDGGRRTLVNVDGTLAGDPHQPGFSVPVARLFE